MLTERQEQLFIDILEHYISTSEPVGSKLLAKTKKWDVSSATLRNEMAALEKAGLIMQPHTSAGRVPTEKGYQYYRNRYLKPDPVTKAFQKALRESFTGASQEGLKNLARELSHITELAAFVGFSRNDLFYTGIRHLLEQFDSEEEVHEVIEMLEEQEEHILSFLETLPKETAVIIGSENPILSRCSIIAAPVEVGTTCQYIGVLGPMRMQYGKMVGLVRNCTAIIIH